MVRERDIFEGAVRFIAEQAAKADALVDEALDAGLDGSHRVTVSAKMLRLELLKVKAELERDVAALALDCSDGGRLLHWVAGAGSQSGHWPRREPAPRSNASMS